MYPSSWFNNNCELEIWAFFDNSDDQMLSDYELLLSLISASLWKSKIGYIDKHNFLSQLKDPENDASQFFLSDNLLSANVIT